MCVLTICVFLSFFPAVAEEASHDNSSQIGTNDQWLGWRGLNKEGRVLNEGIPVTWSNTYDMRWKTSIPGRGHSSPIVYGEDVFLTTCYESTRLLSDKTMLQYLLYGLLMLITTIKTRIVFDYFKYKRFGIGNHLSIIISWMTLLVLAACLLFESTFLEYSGPMNNRSWLFLGFMTSLLIIAASFFLPAKSRLRLLIGLFTLLFLVALVSMIPSPPGKSVLANVFLLRSLDVHSLCYASIPILLLCIGLYHILYSLVVASKHRPDSTSVDEEVIEPQRGVRLKALLVCFELLCLSLLLILVIRTVLQSSYYLRLYLLENARYTPALGWWSIVGYICTLAAFILLGIARSHRLLPMKRVWKNLYRTVILVLTVLLFLNITYLASESTSIWAIVCIDRSTGDIKWTSEGLTGPLMGRRSSHNSPATPTPVTDGERIYAYFGTPGLFCVDMQGRTLWINNDLEYANDYGVACSPVAMNNTLIVVVDTPMSPYVVALDCLTGREKWRRERDNEGFDHNGNSRTPLIKGIGDRKVVIVWGANDVTFYDLVSGDEVHRFKCQGDPTDRVLSAITDESMHELYLFFRYGAICVSLDKLSMKESIAWACTDIDGPNCSSPVLCNGLLFAIADTGVITCVDQSTGEIVWTNKIKGRYFSSPVAIGNNVYFFSSSGVSTIISADRNFRIIAEFDVEERIYASPAVVGDQLLVRTTNNLYCIGN